MKKILITGSSGLVGSECVKFFCNMGYDVTGIDNDRRAYFFGESSSTSPMKKVLEELFPKNFKSISADIRDIDSLVPIFKECGPFDLIIHAAAQPAHDWSIDNTVEDFNINATGTVNMLDTFRRYSSNAVYIQVSTSKVYGDWVNKLPLKELDTRFEVDLAAPDLPEWVTKNGATEMTPIQSCIHSPFGASKACGDIMAQEFARYYNLKVAIFRPVCITGAAHQGAKLHGYLAYLVKCIANKEKYIINGYKGKQVRGNIHGHDLATAFNEVFEADCPYSGEFYNIDGDASSVNSILEAISQIENVLGVSANIEYSDVNRKGDHMWCVFDSSKFELHYPKWSRKYNGDKIIRELCNRYIAK